MAIFNVTLKRDFKKVPKGTVLTIVTSGSSDHSTSMIPCALRKEGYADDDFEGIMNSAYWEWSETSGDEAAIKNDLARYSARVASDSGSNNSGTTNNDSGSNNSGTTNKKKKERDGDPMCVKIIFSIFPFLEIWWIIKALIEIVLTPFRMIFSCRCGYSWPSYNFTKW